MKSVVNSTAPDSRNTSTRRSSRPRTPLKMVRRVPTTPDWCSINKVATSSTSKPNTFLLRHWTRLAGPNTQQRMSTAWIECSSKAPPPA